MVKKEAGCSWCAGWSAKDWLWASVSEGALYMFLWYVIWMLEVSIVNQWLGALVSLALLNIALFACPLVREHYL